MRAGQDEFVLVFNGQDGEWLAQIASRSRRECLLTVVAQTRLQRTEPGPWLVFAPLKKMATDIVVEKATELGASRLLPIFTGRTIASRVNLSRLRARVIEAAEQCERLTVPEVMEPASLAALAKAWPPERCLLVLDEHGQGDPLQGCFARADAASPAPPGFLVGPEGGFLASELDDLDRLPFVIRASLGPRILRAETAALAALASWQTMLGDWSEPPPSRCGTSFPPDGA